MSSIVGWSAYAYKGNGEFEVNRRFHNFKIKNNRKAIL